MPVPIAINPFAMNLCFHIDCAFVILMPKLFCRDLALRDSQFIQQVLEFFINTALKASDLYPLYGLHKALVSVKVGSES